MSDAAKNKLAAQIIKAEMMNDTQLIARLKSEYDSLSKKLDATPKQTPVQNKPTSNLSKSNLSHGDRECRETYQKQRRPPVDNRVKKFIASTNSLSQMFVQEKSLSASDEAKMFVKTASKFSRDDMETKYFSEEVDDSQLILNKPKRHKQEPPKCSLDKTSNHVNPTTREHEYCDGCMERQARHLVIENLDHVYMTLANSKPYLSSMSNVIIRNVDHLCDSFVSSSEDHQRETLNLIESLKDVWKSKGYRLIVMETYFRNGRFSAKDFASCGNHFQIHCLPVKEKHLEKARMCFRQALLDSGGEWSMNKKLVSADGRHIQRRLPKGLSYFWVCFDALDNGFGHVIECERDFSRFFGLEVMSSLLDKDFNPMKLKQHETYKEQFERCRDFKLMYSGSRKSKDDG